MVRISSNATLLLKVFLPTLWTVFFGLFTLAVWLTDALMFSALPPFYFKLAVLTFFILGTAILYFTVFQLKRIEVDASHIYVSNYFETVRYPFHDIQRVTENNIGLGYLIQFHLAASGKFGKTIPFVLDNDMWRALLVQYPEIVHHLKGIRDEE